jgi:hypothetical protein
MRREFAGALCPVMSRGDRREPPAAAAGRLRATHYGAERREAREAKALRIMEEELGRLGRDAAALKLICGFMFIPFYRDGLKTSASSVEPPGLQTRSGKHYCEGPAGAT